MGGEQIELCPGARLGSGAIMAAQSSRANKPDRLTGDAKDLIFEDNLLLVDGA
ncbi:hypothetical protein [Streptomyces qinglanensis]|uniref:hypothetical protein n=1 Tax=Streptomyces qinglanensis TaxID=943816 RepID=UPI003D741DB4